tara:strand:- start:455 stop:3172 length:2718 start_codon:yes stop_codon:yes gene_type:complete
MANKTIAIKVDLQGTEVQKKKLAGLETEVKKLTIQRTKLNKQLKDGTINTKQYGVEIAKINTGLKAHRRQLLVTRQEMLNIDGFTTRLGKSFKKMGTSIVAGFAGLFAIQQLTRLIGDSVRTIKDFEQQMARVEAITGATDEEIKALSDSAKTLGSTTRKTATEVGKLQEELAKLGFTTDEILDATGAIINLSEATGSDLAQSSSVAAGVLNAFGLEAKDTKQLVDVMAKSFSSSALDLNKFEIGMANIGPVTAEAGLSVEETTAMLGILVDRNVQASKAGTGLRNVFLTLSKEGKTLEGAMAEINSATDRSAKAVEIFGKENAVVATILADTRDEVNTLNNALNNTDDDALRMAETMGDTLSGDLDKLTSAYEGFILSLDSGEGAISRTIRGFLDFATESLRLLTILGKTTAQLKQDAFDEKLPERIKQIRKDEEQFQKDNLERVKNRKDLQNATDKQILDAQVLLLESEKNLTEIAVKRIQDKIKEGNLTEEQLQTENNRLTTQQAQLDIQNELLTNFKVEQGLQKDLEEIERLKRVEKNKTLRLEKESAERRKKEVAENKKTQEAVDRDTEKSILNKEKLEQEALNIKKISTLQTEREIEDEKLNIAREAAKKQVDLSKATEEAKRNEKIAIDAKFDAEAEALKLQRKEEDKVKEDEEQLELRQQQLDYAQETANLLSDISQARVTRQKDLALASLDAQLEQGLISQEQFDKKREEIERKAFQRQKKIDIATTVANGAVAAGKTIASLGGVGAITPAGIAALALVAAKTATQVGIISSQSFAEGGYTGSGFGSPDSSGFKQAGVVHEGEYVVPKNVLESQRGSSLVGALEAMRTNRPQPFSNFGFANGGFASGGNIDIGNLRAEISQAVADSVGAIQVVNNATDTISQAARVNNIQSEATFG